MARRRGLGALLAAALLVASLASCGTTGALDLVRLVEAPLGSWVLESAEFDDGSVSAEDLAEMGSFGMRVTLDLDGDGSMLIDAFGRQRTGTWMIRDAETLSLTLGGESVGARIDAARITLSYGGETMVFSKTSDEPVMDRDPSENAGDLEGLIGNERGLVGEPSGGYGSSDLSYLFSDEMVVWQRLYAASVEAGAPLDVIVGEDEVALVRIVGIGTDAEGDTGYLVSVENRTDADFALINSATVLDGVDVWDHATLCCVVAPGEAVEGFFYFDHEAATITQDSTCELSLLAIDRSGVILATYDAVV